MTNPNPIRPKNILTENYVRERLDVIQREFFGSSNRQQAQLEETNLCNEFIRASMIPGGVRQPREVAKALVNSTNFITI